MDQQDNNGTNMSSSGRPRGDSEGSDEWMLIETEKFQECLDQSLLMSSSKVLQDIDHGTKILTTLEEMPVLEQCDSVTSNLSKSHSSVESSASSTSSAKGEQNTFHEEVKGDSRRQYSANMLDSTLSAKELFQQHFNNSLEHIDDRNVEEDALSEDAASSSSTNFRLIEELRSALQTTEREREELKRSLQTTEREREELKRSLQTTEREREEMKRSLQTTEREREELKRSLQTTERERGELRSSLQTTERDRKELRSSIQTAERDRKELRSSLQTAERDRKELRSALQTIESERDYHMNRYNALLEESTRCAAMQESESTSTSVASLTSNFKIFPQSESFTQTSATIDANTRELDGYISTMLSSFSERLQNLERETRQVRWMLEHGGDHLIPSHHTQQSAPEEETRDLRTLVAEVDDNLEKLASELIPIVSRLCTPTQESQPSTSSDLKISLKNFEANDIALFFPTPKGDYLAFNIGAPYHFLAAESKALIGQDTHFKKLYVLGRIVMKETHSANGDANTPQGLKAGTQYHTLSVSSIAEQLK